MTLLSNLKADSALFHTALPQKPQGRYVNFVLVRETESFPLFQTDGTLNVIRVRAGATHAEPMTRLVMFKRKQSSPERLTGRELLRYYNIISDAEKSENHCVYNSADFCKKCPDCILYGYAIGSAGAEKSKVYVDSAFSITRYEGSHKAFSFNALYEHGTMTDKGETRSSFGEQDYVVPQVFFPSIVTLRDPTFESFVYVLGNLLRTDRYGAQETRTGKVFNHLIGVVWTNGEIFSNLSYTQHIYDHLAQAGVNLADTDLLLERTAVLTAAHNAYIALMSAEPVARLAELVGPEADTLRTEVTALYSDTNQTEALLQDLNTTALSYAEIYGALR